MSGNASHPFFGDTMHHHGHIFRRFQSMVEPPYAVCLECSLKITAEMDVEAVVAAMGPCPNTEEGRRLTAEAEREHAQSAPITEPCIATPPDWEGTDAEAIGLAVAGAVADLARQRDKAEQSGAKVFRLLKDLVDVFPQTSFAGANVPLEEARRYLATIAPPTPSADQ